MKYSIAIVFIAIIVIFLKSQYNNKGYDMTQDAKSHIITHAQPQIFDLPLYQHRLNDKKFLTLSLEENTQLLNQLSEFELGRFLLQNQGLNGYWTAYLILHGLKKENLLELEKWLLLKAPTVNATRERFYVFRKQVQHYMQNGMKIASVPCGLMDDLLGLDYSNLSNIEIVGIDLDQKSLDFALENTKLYHHEASFIKKDAWSLGVHNEYDIMISNGLNIYESDDKKVVGLYKEFFNALKSGGILITSFLTPPPALSAESPWHDYNQDDALKQKAIFTDIIQTKWQVFRTEEKVRQQLEEASFKVIEVIYDSQGIFPTIIAKK